MLNRSRETLRDGVLFGGVVAVLFLVALLVPPEVQTSLAFNHGAVEPLTLYTAAFFHLSWQHLYSNAFAYLTVVFVTYRLARSSGSLGWFRGAALVQLTATPVLVNFTSWLLVSSWYPGLDPVSRGFSGVVAGFVGVAIVALHRYAETVFGHATALAVGLAAFVSVWVIADLRHSGSVNPTTLVVLLTAVGTVVVASHRDGVLSLDVDGFRLFAGTTAVAAGGAVIAILAIGLFPGPTGRTVGGSFVNVYAHAAGVLWGLETSFLLRAA